MCLLGWQCECTILLPLQSLTKLCFLLSRRQRWKGHVGGVVVGHPVPSPTKQETYGLSDIWGHYKPSLSFKVWYSAGLQIKIFVFNMNKKTFSLWMPDNRNNDVKEQELLSPQAMIDLTFIPDSPKDRPQGVWSQGGKSGREYTVRTVYIGEKNKYVQHYVSLPNWESLKL